MKTVYVIERLDLSKSIPEIIELLPFFFESKKDAMSLCSENCSVVELCLYEEKK